MLDRVRTASMDAAIAKLFVSESLLRTALNSVQIHGGYGYRTEFQVERALRDAVGSTIYSGTSERQRNIIACWLGLESELGLTFSDASRAARERRGGMSAADT